MAESDLYDPVHDYLEQRFRYRLQPLLGELRTVSAITDTAGGPGTGKWSKPDLCLVAYWRQKYGPAWRLDLHGFEVKPEGKCDAGSVHEALNHTAHVHFAHLVWHNPTWADDQKRCKEVLDRCRRYGVGLITMTDPRDASSYEVRLQAERHEPAGDAVDEFIDSRLPDHAKAAILDWLRGA